MGLLKQLEAIINLLLIAHPQGLRVLLGQSAPPGAEDIAQMLSSIRSTGEPDVRLSGGQCLPEAERVLASDDAFNAIINSAGGWEHINRVALEWAKFYPKMWAIIVAHTSQIMGSSYRIDDAPLERISKKHGVSKDTICRYRKDFPYNLARAILAQPVNGDLFFMG